MQGCALRKKKNKTKNKHLTIIEIALCEKLIRTTLDSMIEKHIKHCHSSKFKTYIGGDGDYRKKSSKNNDCRFVSTCSDETKLVVAVIAIEVPIEVMVVEILGLTQIR